MYINVPDALYVSVKWNRDKPVKFDIYMNEMYISKKKNEIKY